MKRFTNFVVLTGAALVVGCASQAPAPSSATAVRHDSITATSTGTSANQASAPAAPATAAATPQKAKFVIPDGYDEVDIQGHTVYCTKEAPTGSRVQHKTCRTQAQLEADQEAARRLMDTVGQQNSAVGQASVGVHGEGTQMAGPR